MCIAGLPADLGWLSHKGGSSKLLLRKVAIFETALPYAASERSDRPGSAEVHQAGVKWCIETRGELAMVTQASGERSRNDQALRTSVSFPPELYRLLEQIASQKKVSLAWVIRDASEKYVAEQWPLLSKIT
jgi:hypothetical protein